MYIVFEGIDGVGKSSIMHAVQQKLIERKLVNCKIHLSKQPGSTPLGVHIRKLVKHPETISPDIVIDPKTLQLLYMVDTSAFVETILKPAMNNDEWILSDRTSFISALTYGMADGLQLDDIKRLYDVVDSPRADVVYILRSSFETIMQRLSKRHEVDGVDHFESKGGGFLSNIQSKYDGLLTSSIDQSLLLSRFVSLQNIVYVNNENDIEFVVEFIVDDIISRIKFS